MMEQPEFDQRIGHAVQYARESKLAEAEDIYRTLLQNDVGGNRNQSLVLHYLGIVVYYQGNREAAKQLTEQAITVDPSYKSAYQWLAYFYWQGRQGYKVPGLMVRYFRNLRGIVERASE